MFTSHFEHCTDNELLDAFEEYQHQQMGIYGKPGTFAAVAKELEAEEGIRGRQRAVNELLYTMACKWYLGLRPVGKILEADDDVWVIQYGEVKAARVVRVEENGEDGRDYVYWIQAYDEDMDEAYPEKQLGTRFFRTELAAHNYLEQIQPAEPDDGFWL